VRRRPLRRLVALAAVVVLGGFLLDRACAGPPPLRGVPGAQQPLPQASSPSVQNSQDPDAGNVPAEELATRARIAARDARAFELTGRADLPETGPVDVALSLSQSLAAGQLTVDGTRVRVRRSGMTISTRPADQPTARWTQSADLTTATGRTVNLYPLTDRSQWLDLLIPSPEGATARPKPERLPGGGAPVTRVRLRDGQLVYLPSTGTPWPARVVRSGPYPMTLDLTGWQ
jgi:hypothetical protein